MCAQHVLAKTVLGGVKTDKCNPCRLLSKVFWMQLPTGMENQTNASNFRELVEEAWQSHASSIRVPSQVIVAFQMTL